MQKNSKKKKKKNAKYSKKDMIWKKEKKRERENCCFRLSKGLKDLLVGKLSSAKKRVSDHINCLKKGKWAQYLDGAPEGRTERRSPRFRPDDRFWSKGSDTRFVPFIHSVQFVTTSHFYVYMKVYHFFLPSAKWRCVLLW